jgi:hypothetical protein
MQNLFLVKYMAAHRRYNLCPRLFQPAAQRREQSYQVDTPFCQAPVERRCVIGLQRTSPRSIKFIAPYAVAFYTVKLITIILLVGCSPTAITLIPQHLAAICMQVRPVQ